MFKSSTIAVVANVFKSETKSDVIKLETPATEFILEIFDAIVPILVFAAATTPISVASAATAVISLLIPATVVISDVILDNVAKPEDETVVSILPLASNPNILDCLVALAGKVTVAETVSVSNNFTDLSVCPFKSPTIAVNWSSCVC